jgi:hypothetical protein
MVFGVAFSPNGMRLATTSLDGKLTMWDTTSGQRLFTCPVHSNFATAVAFSPDGKTLATASYDRTAKVWNAVSCQGPLHTFTHMAAVNDVAFSPDGKTLATVGEDNELHIYLLDFEELIALAETRVTRPLTAMECQEFLHMECPKRLAGTLSELPYSDDFSTATGDWRIGADEKSTSNYKDGQYHITVVKDYLVAWENPRKNLDDFALEVEATQVEGPDNNQYGVILRYIDRDNFYRFGISGTGDYMFSKLENGVWSTLVERTESSAIRRGNATNVIRVVCQGDTFTFFVNGVELDSYTDSAFAAGDIGLFASTFEEGNVHISFDNLQVDPVR